MAKKKNFGELRKKISYLGIGTIIGFVLDWLIPSIGFKIIIELAIIGMAIAGIVYGIKLIKEKDYSVGVPAVIISSLIVLFFFLAFMLGFIVAFVGTAAI